MLEAPWFSILAYTKVCSKGSRQPPHKPWPFTKPIGIILCTRTVREWVAIDTTPHMG